MSADTPKPLKRSPTGSVGSPACLKLQQWGRLLNDAFGEMPYQVGSSIVSKQWRDVDVRMVLDDEQWERWIGRTETPHSHLATWNILCTALSVWGSEFTGLPIDFQFQLRSEVTDEDWDKFRSPIGIGFYGIDIDRDTGDTAR